MSPSIHDDPFVTELLAKLPPDLRHSFSAEQLLGLKMAIGARKWGAHAIDLRRTLALGRSRYYLVLLAGRESRAAHRQTRLGRAAELAMATLFLFATVLFGLGVLYLLKSAFGVDLFPDFSLGFWSWITDI